MSATITVCPRCGSPSRQDRRAVRPAPALAIVAACSHGWHDGSAPGYERPAELVRRDREQGR